MNIHDNDNQNIDILLYVQVYKNTTDYLVHILD